MQPLYHNSTQTGGWPLLNVAATCTATHALGPGLRAVVWVQGCPFNCPGCLAPDWIPMRQARTVAPEDLVAELLAHPQVTGLTFSGGEPMLQAAGLTRLINLAREQRPLSLICFSGFTLAQLRDDPPGPSVADLLDQIDVLIDGRYVARQNDHRGLRGSRNQRIHYLTDRLAEFDFASGPRQIEIQVQADHVLLVGVPPRGAITLIDQALEHVCRARTAG
ncbi:radical SAM protein [Candidatus Chloroploca sp. M-50]|uniref:Radical SAM protein n=1 Tax=Candidatus Chloroploca mongolica TaxID=2528176 RepID=A0ABS4DAM0_9CHLR|nr:4Fe-4S single cluster domain-containing protein [Candidatus Chloroploca mongolica]MBP1466482.1 radical SAM protein [Candidatus Chloroploca mongolica]